MAETRTGLQSLETGSPSGQGSCRTVVPLEMECLLDIVGTMNREKLPVTDIESKISVDSTVVYFLLTYPYKMAYYQAKDPCPHS